MKTCKRCGEILEKGIELELYSQIIWDKELEGEKGIMCDKCWIERLNIKKLYHISKNCSIKEELVAGVPENRMDDYEDAITNRVCLSSSIEGALSSVPWGGNSIYDIMLDDCGSELIRVYEFDTEDLDMDNLISPDFLYQHNLVRDAYGTREFWYTKDLKPSRSYLIELDNFRDDSSIEDVDYKDFVAGLSKDLDFHEITSRCFIIIDNISYTKVSEDDRSSLFSLNNKILGDMGEDIFDEVAWAAEEPYVSSMSWCKVKKENGEFILEGMLDTRYHETRKNKTIDKINDNLKKLTYELDTELKLV